MLFPLVGRRRGKARGGNHGSKPDHPRHIIARFISRKDRYLVWSQLDEIKKTEHFSDAFLVPDLVKEYAKAGFKLRQALQCARDVFKPKVELRKNQIVMVESGLLYSLTELQDYIKNEIDRQR